MKEEMIELRDRLTKAEKELDDAVKCLTRYYQVMYNARIHVERNFPQEMKPYNEIMEELNYHPNELIMKHKELKELIRRMGNGIDKL